MLNNVNGSTENHRFACRPGTDECDFKRYFLNSHVSRCSGAVNEYHMTSSFPDTMIVAASRGRIVIFMFLNFSLYRSKWNIGLSSPSTKQGWWTSGRLLKKSCFAHLYCSVWNAFHPAKSSRDGENTYPPPPPRMNFFSELAIFDELIENRSSSCSTAYNLSISLICCMVLRTHS